MVEGAKVGTKVFGNKYLNPPPNKTMQATQTAGVEAAAHLPRQLFARLIYNVRSNTMFSTLVGEVASSAYKVAGFCFGHEYLTKTVPATVIGASPGRAESNGRDSGRLEILCSKSPVRPRSL